MTFAGEVDDRARAHHGPRRAAPPRIDGLDARPRRTALYDGVIEARRRSPAPTGQRSVLVLSDGADTSATPARRRHRRRRGRRGQRRRRRPRPAAAKASTRSAQIADGRPGHVITRRTRAARRASFPPRPTPCPPDPGHRRRCRAGIEPTRPRRGHAADAGRLAHRRRVTAVATTGAPVAAPSAVDRRRRRRSIAGRRLMLGGAGCLALGLAVVRDHRWCSPATAAQPQPRSRSPLYTAAGHAGEPSAAAKRTPSRRRLDQAKATAVAERAAPQQATSRTKIAPRLEAAGSELKPAEWLLLHGGIAVGVGAPRPAARRRQRRSSCCRLFVGVVAARGSTSASRRRAGSRPSTASCPTPCS